MESGLLPVSGQSSSEASDGNWVDDVDVDLDKRLEEANKRFI